MKRTLAAALATTLIACVGAPPPTPGEATDEALETSCNGRFSNREDCSQLARRRLEQGQKAQALEPLTVACSEYGTACIELGTLYLQGHPGVPQDQAKGFEYAIKGCNVSKRDHRGCGWQMLEGLTRYPAAPEHRDTVESVASRACRYGKTHGWPCYNYGVGLACGLFYDKDLGYAEHVLNRGCTLGDTRACELAVQVRDRPDEPVSCTMIGPDPDVPVQITMNLEPLPEGTVWPEGQTRHERKLMP